jgi:hypothetical protein
MICVHMFLSELFPFNVRKGLWELFPLRRVQWYPFYSRVRKDKVFDCNILLICYIFQPCKKSKNDVHNKASAWIFIRTLVYEFVFISSTLCVSCVSWLLNFISFAQYTQKYNSLLCKYVTCYFMLYKCFHIFTFTQ